jgi:hypothetical protein
MPVNLAALWGQNDSFGDLLEHDQQRRKIFYPHNMLLRIALQDPLGG